MLSIIYPVANSLHFPKATCVCVWISSVLKAAATPPLKPERSKLEHFTLSPLRVITWKELNGTLPSRILAQQTDK